MNSKKKVKFPILPLDVADFLSDANVLQMSNRELGCYIKLLCVCWWEYTIPKDVEKLARLCGEGSDSMDLIWPAIEHCFKEMPDGSGYHHSRLDKERQKLLNVESGEKTPTLGQEVDLLGQAIEKPEAKKKAVKKPKKVVEVNPEQEACRLTFKSYSEAHKELYKVDINLGLARNHSIIKQIVKEVGQDLAPEIVKFYFKLNDQYFVRSSHDLSVLKLNLTSVLTRYEQVRQGVTSTGGEQKNLKNTLSGMHGDFAKKDYGAGVDQNGKLL